MFDMICSYSTGSEDLIAHCSVHHIINLTPAVLFFSYAYAYAYARYALRQIFDTTSPYYKALPTPRRGFRLLTSSTQETGVVSNTKLQLSSKHVIK